MHRLTHMGVIKGGEAELVGAVEVVELHIGLAAKVGKSLPYSDPDLICRKD
jgi:hypothetical protein